MGSTKVGCRVWWRAGARYIPCTVTFRIYPGITGLEHLRRVLVAREELTKRITNMAQHLRRANPGSQQKLQKAEVNDVPAERRDQGFDSKRTTECWRTRWHP